jgi:pSer/pThr/pTyr-binding forkhead associated (FHA) protein
VLDDGSVFQLDAEYVIGREPTSDKSVTSGRRRALVLDDDYKSVSRAHARIELHDWDVVLFDDDSANGTFVAAEGATTWQHVPPGKPHVLRAGARILIGRRTMIFHARRAG